MESYNLNFYDIIGKNKVIAEKNRFDEGKVRPIFSAYIGIRGIQNLIVELYCIRERK